MIIKLIMIILSMINVTNAYAYNNNDNNRIGPKSYIYYRYKILTEANGIAIIKVSYCNLSEISSRRNKNELEFTNNNKNLPILLNENFNRILEHYVTRNYKKSHSPYGCLRIDLKSGRTFYIIMHSDVTKINIISNDKEADYVF